MRQHICKNCGKIYLTDKPDSWRTNIMKIITENEQALLYTPYNPDFVRRVKTIGGARWDAKNRVWRIPVEAVDRARQIMREVYGECDLPDGTERVTVKLTFSKDVIAELGPIIIYGKQIASASSRDSGARVGQDVAFLEGEPGSGGSRNSWNTYIDAGSVVQVNNVPKTMLSEVLPDGVTYEIMPDTAMPNRETLLAEKDRLLSRLKEIEKLLEGGNQS